MLARLSVIGLYNYDNTLFDPLSLPEGLSKEAAVDLILNECSEFATRYPNNNVFKERLAQWSVRRRPIWERLYSTTLLEYNPIQNYDRTETYTETVTHTGTDETSATSDTIQAGTVANVGTAAHTGTVQDTENGNDTKAITSFDSNSFADSEKVTTTNTQTHTNNLSDSTNNTETRNLSDSTTTEGTRTVSSQDTVRKETRAYGNIGVTTSQQMIESERTIAQFDMYNVILQDFIDYFCVAVY